MEGEKAGTAWGGLIFDILNGTIGKKAGPSAANAPAYFGGF